jgi:hypothetical protein
MRIPALNNREMILVNEDIAKENRQLYYSHTCSFVTIKMQSGLGQTSAACKISTFPMAPHRVLGRVSWICK